MSSGLVSADLVEPVVVADTMTETFWARALFDFTPEYGGEIALDEGDVVFVSDASDVDWWVGSVSGREGMFPGTYVERIDHEGGEEDVPASNDNPEWTKRRKLIAEELVETERKYQANLATIVDHFLSPVRDKWRDEDDVTSLFGNIEELLALNTELLSRLEETSDIGMLFVEWGPKLHGPYVEYVVNYGSALRMLSHMHGKSTGLAKLVRNAESHDVCQGLGLASFLILPIQRVPRYELLLRDLVGHMPRTHRDFVPLNAALEVIGELASRINTSKAEAESREKILEIQEAVTGNCPDLLQVSDRMFVRDGRLHQLKGGKAKHRYAVLLSDALLLLRPVSGILSSSRRYRFKELLVFGDAYVRRPAASELEKLPSAAKHSFFITMPRSNETYILCLDSEATAEVWFTTVRDRALAALSSFVAEMVTPDASPMDMLFERAGGARKSEVRPRSASSVPSKHRRVMSLMPRFTRLRRDSSDR